MEPASYAALGASQARGMPRTRFKLRAACAHDQMLTPGYGRRTAPSRPGAALARRTRRYAACRGPFPAAEAAFGLQRAASAVSLGEINCQRADDGQVEVAALGATCQRLHRAVVAVEVPGHEQRCQHVVGSRAGSDVPVLSVAAASCAARQMGEEGM